MDSLWVYFVWCAKLYKSQPILSGVMVLVTMVGLGIAWALLADVVIRLTGINVGSYKKEYEE